MHCDFYWLNEWLFIHYSPKFMNTFHVLMEPVKIRQHVFLVNSTCDLLYCNMLKIKSIW